MAHMNGKVVTDEQKGVISKVLHDTSTAEAEANISSNPRDPSRTVGPKVAMGIKPLRICEKIQIMYF